VSNPLKVFFVWEGGMSIHGGIFFGFLAVLYFAKKEKIDFLRITDLFSVPLALGLAFGRLANFVNQELVGRVTDSRVGVVFPLYDEQMRWPYQIFAGLKNLFVFNVLLFLQFFSKQKTGFLTGWFL